MEVDHYLPYSGEVIKSLQSDPEAFSARFSITLSSKNFIHPHMRMFKKTISRLCLSSALTGLGNADLRPCIKLTHNAHKPLSQTPVSQIGLTKFIFSPILNLPPLQLSHSQTLRESDRREIVGSDSTVALTCR